MAFEKPVPTWNAPGTEPPDSLKNSGFQVGYKPPADYFNWFMYAVSQALTELLNKSLDKEAVNIEGGTDLDNITELGIYTYSISASSTITNAPLEQAQVTILVLPRLMKNRPENVIQVAFTSNNCIYVRNRSDSVWNSWRKFFKDDDIIPIAHGGTGGKTAEAARANLGVAATNHGRHVPSYCVTIEDWNNAVENGWYMGNNAANAPFTDSTTSMWYFGYVIAHNANYVLQEVYQFTASNDARSIGKFIRARKEGVWGAWVNVTVQRDVPVDAKLDYIKTLTGDAQTQLNNRMYAKPSIIEMNPATDANHGGYIDFHYNGTTDDFTSRIIEEAQGCIRFSAPNGAKVSTIDPSKDALRNIQAGTTDMTAGTSQLATGAIYFVYEE